ncbi:ribosomal protein S16 domain-containing protein [Crassisporium funariophilum]|nr:ribosomal protein S16 domain-containing protein [Crassisporium funariophilum]
MAIRLRMAMHGHRHHRIFHLVAIDRRLRRDAKPAELLGIYDPHIKEKDEARVVRWSVDRIRYWLSVGATPSKSAIKMLELGGILKPGSPFHTTATSPRHPVITSSQPTPASQATP